MDNDRETLLRTLQSMKHLPTDRESEDNPERLELWQTLLDQLPAPVSDLEAIRLSTFFPVDDSDSYGLAWELLHLIETAPTWPIEKALSLAPDYWREMMTARLKSS